MVNDTTKPICNLEYHRPWLIWPEFSLPASVYLRAEDCIPSWVECFVFPKHKSMNPGASALGVSYFGHTFWFQQEVPAGCKHCSQVPQFGWTPSGYKLGLSPFFSHTGTLYCHKVRYTTFNTWQKFIYFLTFAGVRVRRWLTQRKHIIWWSPFQIWWHQPAVSETGKQTPTGSVAWAICDLREYIRHYSPDITGAQPMYYLRQTWLSATIINTRVPTAPHSLSTGIRGHVAGYNACSLQQ
jgi:hypothetical protein